MTITLLAPLDGWVLPLDGVPDAVFAERMLGDGVAIDPTGDRLVAPCAGVVASLQPSGHAVTIRSDDGFEILIHLGLDTVMLAGRGFAPQVTVGDRVAAGDELIRFDLDLLVREARAVVTPVVLVGDGHRVATRAAPGAIVAGTALMTLTVAEAATTAEADPGGTRFARTVVVPLPHGIHARPAARLAAAARRFDAVATIDKAGETAPVASPTGLLALAIGCGDTVTVAATGPDAAAAVDALTTLIAGGMDEAPAPPPVHAAPPPAGDVPAGALAGVTAAPGLAIGTVRRHRGVDIEVAERGCGVATEEADFLAARTALVAELEARAAAAGGAAQSILLAHLALLDDPALVDAATAGIARGESAGFAWRGAVRPQVDTLRRGGDPRLAERADDLIDLERQLLAKLPGATATGTVAWPADTILIADDLLPSDLIGVRPGMLAGIASARGGPTSHVAIIAGSIGLPALVAVGDALAGVADGATVILDATAGLLHLDPDPARIAGARGRIATAAERRAAMLARAAADCRTSDGVRIEVVANCGSPADAVAAIANGAEGCGLLRTELLFLDRAAAPSVAEQAAAYQAVADALDGRPLIVRLLDIGGDKPVAYLPIGDEENPALGLRGIRVGLSRPDLLADQLRAILSVAPRGQCRVMIPMIASLVELRAVRGALDAVAAELAVGEPVPLGIMVETPAAAITADLLAAEADFLSIGTNDLTQYTLAMDRGNAAVADGIDGLHPAVLRLIAATCRGGARHDRWTGVCGGLASDPLAVPILVGLGVTELSATPALVPEIKAIVAALSLSRARAHAEAALACTSAAEVRALAREFAREMAA